MLAPYRIATKPEPDGPEEADVYEALLRARAARSRRVATAVCGAIAALSIVALAETPPKRRASDPAEARAAAKISNTRDTIAGARSHALAEQAKFVATMSAAFDADITPDPTAPPCSVVLPEVGLGRGKSAFPLLVVAKGDRDLPSPSVARMLADVNRADEHLATGHFMEAIRDANALSNELASGTTRSGYEVVLVTTALRHPIRTTPTSFEPGEISGRAYLYDFSQHRVACVGDIHATSSRRIEYSFVPASVGPAAMDEGPRLSASLDDDLELQIRRAIGHDALVQVTDPR